MRLNKVDKDARIVELYKRGWSFKQLQNRYHRSPNYIAQLVKGIEVTCTACGKPKGKVRFHAHHQTELIARITLSHFAHRATPKKRHDYGETNKASHEHQPPIRPS